MRGLCGSIDGELEALGCFQGFGSTQIPTSEVLESCRGLVVQNIADRSGCTSHDAPKERGALSDSYSNLSSAFNVELSPSSSFHLMSFEGSSTTCFTFARCQV
jgi:hypothetical protein